MKAILYYDGQCPLCSKEISVLRRLTQKQVDFADIHQINKKQVPSKEQLLRRLHLQTSTGEWLIGLDATICIWSYTKYGFMFKLLNLPLIKPIASRIYRHWADKRFEKRYRCEKCIN